MFGFGFPNRIRIPHGSESVGWHSMRSMPSMSDRRRFSPLAVNAPGAPLSGEPAVAYEYSIGRDQRIGKSTSFVSYFDGKALAASTIVMPSGVMRILAKVCRGLSANCQPPTATFSESARHSEQRHAHPDNRSRDRQRHKYEGRIATFQGRDRRL